MWFFVDCFFRRPLLPGGPVLEPVTTYAPLRPAGSNERPLQERDPGSRSPARSVFLPDLQPFSDQNYLFAFFPITGGDEGTFGGSSTRKQGESDVRFPEKPRLVDVVKLGPGSPPPGRGASAPPRDRTPTICPYFQFYQFRNWAFSDGCGKDPNFLFGWLKSFFLFGFFGRTPSVV